MVTPVPMVRNPNDIENDVKQISVLLHMTTVDEKIQLQLNITDLTIKNNQHAFIRARSTVSALTSMTQN